MNDDATRGARNRAAARMETPLQPVSPIRRHRLIGAGIAQHPHAPVLVGDVVSIGLTILVPLYFEVVHKLTATQSGIALIPLALTTPGSLLAGRARLYWRHYTRAPIIGLVCALAALAPLIWRPDLPLLYVTVIMGVVGTAIGLVYPVTTVSIVAAKASVTVVLSQAPPMLAPT